MKLPDEVLTNVQTNITDEECSKKALVILQKAMEKTLAKLKQSALANVTAATQETVIKLTTDLGQKLIDIAEGWNKEVNQSLILYPENTRFLARRNGMQVVVIEHKPQIRSVYFSDSLERGELNRDAPGRPYRLALPYVTYILQVASPKDLHGDSPGVRSGLVNIRVGFHAKPLGSLEDVLYRPVLPNNKSDLSVCTGTGFSNLPFNGKNLSEVTDHAIAQFWQSKFNKDLRDHYDVISTSDPRWLIKNWEKETKKNPLWVLENPTWASRGGHGHLGSHIKALIGDNQNVNITAELQREVSAVVSTVSDKLKRSLDAIVLDKIRAGEVTAQFAVILKDIIQESYDQLWAFCEKKLEGERHKERVSLESLVQRELEKMIYYAQSLKNEKWGMLSDPYKYGGDKFNNNYDDDEYHHH